ncbi:MAG: glycosyltransferase [Prevotellaceae bacterium]|nr:glycosyltransferase [Prevotellaceae bacterium]
MGKGHEVKAVTFSRMYPNFLFPGKTQYVEGYSKFSKINAIRVLDSVNPVSYYKTARIIKKFQPDIVIIAYWMTFFIPAYTAIARLLRKNTRIIALFHNVISHEPYFFDKILLKYFIGQSSASIVMSAAVERDLLSLKPDAKFLYKPHPLYDHFGQAVPKAEAREKLGLHPDKKTLLFFGLIRGYKGLDLLIEAFGKLPAEYQLLIAGEPYGSFEKYRAQVAALPNAQDVYVEARYISDAEVPLFFSAADACALPYRSATQSGITSVAYHFGLPMIATDVGGLKEAVVDGETGIIVPRPDADEIAQGVKRFFEPGKAETFAAGIGVLKRSLSWEAFAQAIVDFSQTL